MIDALAFALTAGSVLAAAVLAVRLVRRRHRWSASVPVLALIEVGLTVQLALDVVALAGGHRPPELGVHVAYLVFSVVPLPATAVVARGDDGAWAGLSIVAALLVVAVLVVRMQTTWRSAY